MDRVIFTRCNDYTMLVPIPITQEQRDQGLLVHYRRPGIPADPEPKRCLICKVRLYTGKMAVGRSVAKYCVGCQLDHASPARQKAKYLASLLVIITLFLPANLRAQGNLGSNSSPVVNRQGIPLANQSIAVCQPLSTTAASVSNNLATLTMVSNPVTAGFVPGMTILVAGFTGSDIFFNAGTLTNGTITGGFTILTVSPTAITFQLNHTNGIASSNGTVLQEGNGTTTCGGLSSIFQDPTLSVPSTNPIASDQLGNWNVFAASGIYYVQFYSPTTKPVMKVIGVGLNSLTGVAQLGLGNVFTTSNTFNNGLNVNGPTILSGTVFASTLTCASINGVICADQQVGADACAKIATGLATGAGIINATGFRGTQVCGGGFTISGGQIVLLASINLIVSGQIILSSSGAHLYGFSGVTQIQQNSGFPSSTPIIQIGNGSTISSATVDGVTINCNGGSNSIAGENQNGQELSGFFNVIVQNCTKYSLWYEGSGAQNSSGRGWDILPSGGGGGTIGAYIHNVPSFRGIQDATFNTNDASTIGNQLVLDGVTGGSLENIHFEHGTIGASIGPTTQTVGVTLKNLYGNATVPTLINVANVATNRVTAQNIVGNGSATILNDALNSITDTNTLIKLYDSNAAGFAPVYYAGGQIVKAIGNSVALTADWTCGTGGTVVSCTTAQIIGSGGGVPLTLTLPLATQSYTLTCDGVVGQATGATANQWNLLTATNGAVNITANYSMGTAATASAYGAVTDTASITTTFQIAPNWTLGGTGTKMPFHIWARIEGASVSGTVVSLQLVAPTIGDLVTIYRGSSCTIS
jgi:hypothetical protein